MQATVEEYSTYVPHMSSGDAAYKCSTCLFTKVIVLRVRIRTIPTAISVFITLKLSLQVTHNRFCHGIEHGWDQRSESWLGVGYG